MAREADQAKVFAKRFGKNLRRLREEADLSQELLARRAGVHRTMIGKFEAGERIPRGDAIVRLAGGLGIDSALLLRGIVWKPTARMDGHFETVADPVRRESSPR